MVRLLFVALLLCSTATFAHAEADAPPPAQSVAFFDKHILPGLKLGKFLEYIWGNSQVYSYNAMGLSADTFARYRRIMEARARAGAVATLLTFDINGDRLLTRDEFADAPENLRNGLPYYDRDGDGVVTLDELLGVASFEGPNVFVAFEARQLLAMPEAREGPLTAEGLQRIAMRIFRAADTDHDGVISKAEADAWADAHPAEPMDWRPRFTCLLARPAVWDAVVMVSDFHASYQFPRPVTLRIARGLRPVYLMVVTTDPERWTIEDPSHRVVRMNLTMETFDPDTVRGLAPDRLRQFADGCPFNALFRQEDGIVVRAQAEKLLRRPITRSIEVGRQSLVEIP